MMQKETMTRAGESFRDSWTRKEINHNKKMIKMTMTMQKSPKEERSKESVKVKKTQERILTISASLWIRSKDNPISPKDLNTWVKENFQTKREDPVETQETMAKALGKSSKGHFQSPASQKLVVYLRKEVWPLLKSTFEETH
jgi:hypothetical protein